MDTPNKGQRIAADKFFTFLMNDSDKFVLSGGAGVGKTWLMGYLSNIVMQTYENACKVMAVPQQYNTVVFTATTNKAAEVLEQSINKPVQTIHSYLGLKVQENYKTGKTLLQKTHNYTVRDGVVLFVDESSMIDTMLFDLIMESFTNSKIIFVGDHAQMAPVNETSSKVYQDIDEDNFVFLDEPVRNAGSPALMDLCAQLRNTVETGEFNPIVGVDGHIEYLDEVAMQQKLIEVFAKDLNPEARILCYTNSRVRDFNAYIRDIRGLPENMDVGDVAVVASAYQKGKVNLSVEREMEIFETDDEVRTYLGYGDYFADGGELKYRNISIGTPGGSYATLEVPIAVEKERWTMIMDQLKRQKNWSEFYELKGFCLDLRDKAACTVYKSQGSTYDTVFVDLGNIGTSYDVEQVARMLFVGVSRSTTNVYFFGTLPGKYHQRAAA